MARISQFALLHGAAQASWVWEETLAALAQQMHGREYRAEAFDLPGCGRRRGEDVSNLSVREVAEAFAADLAASGMTDVILVGHSNAGTILPRVALRLPHLIRHIVYVSCLAPAPGQSVRQLVSAGPSAGIDDSADRTGDRTLVPSRKHLQRIFCNDMSEEEATRFLSKLGRDMSPTLRSMDEQDWRYDHLQKVSGTYVVCLRDQTLPPDWQEQFALRFLVQRIVHVHAGHQVINTRPHTLAEILRHEAISIGATG